MLLKYLLLLNVAICLASPSIFLRDNFREELKKKSIFASYEILLQEWKSFKTKHNKTYEPDEDLQRLNIFVENTKLIAEHNDLYDKGVVTYSLEMNKFGDWTEDELKRLHGFIEGERDNNITYYTPTSTAAPVSIDWRKYGYVTPVKYQGQCGSCWAFSAVGALEGQYYRKTKNLVDLSEQNLVDCSYGFGTHGCNGGWMTDAFKYIEASNGIDTQKSYPYEGYQGMCRFKPRYAKAATKGYWMVQADEKSLQQAVAQNGPISVAIDSRGFSFRFYKKGIYYNETCSPTHLSHAVLAVGYGRLDNSGDYWLVKNSWGEDWGEDGYVKMARNRNNNCGIASYAVLPYV